MSSEERLEYYMKSLKLSLLQDLYNEEEPSTVKEVKEVIEIKKPKRCQLDGCNKKLGLTDFACKCKQFYCIAHRFSDNHSCTFDYKATEKEVLKKQLAEVKASCIDKI